LPSRPVAHLAADRFGAIELNVDLKQRGVEPGALAALRRHDLLDRALISTHLPRVLDRVRALEPTARTGGCRSAAGCSGASPACGTGGASSPTRSPAGASTR
jgi:hypothetical protein